MRNDVGRSKGSFHHEDPNAVKPQTKEAKIVFIPKVTKSTKLRSLKISMSETFVAFVVRKCFVELFMHGERLSENFAIGCFSDNPKSKIQNWWVKP